MFCTFEKKNHIFSSNIHFEDPFSGLLEAEKGTFAYLAQKLYICIPKICTFLHLALSVLCNMICVPFTMQNASFTSHRPKG